MAVNEYKGLDIDGLIRNLFEQGPVEHRFPYGLILELYDRAEASLSLQPSLLTVSGEINIVGDIHGQYADLLHIFQKCGYPFEHRYLFLGDYVDRGKNSLEVFVLLLALQIRFPYNVYLLRGNHEDRSVNKQYGFLSEVRCRFPNPVEASTIFNRTSDIYGMLSVSALVNDRILCLHGGISPTIVSLQDLNKIKKGVDRPKGILEDILWSDPTEECDNYRYNEERGCSVEFGNEALKKVFESLNISLLVRGHQVNEDGVKVSNGKRVITLFSAPGYMENVNNKAAVMHVSRQSLITFTYITQQKMRTAATVDKVPHTE